MYKIYGLIALVAVCVIVKFSVKWYENYKKDREEKEKLNKEYYRGYPC